jgi:hypothetical protein
MPNKKDIRAMNERNLRANIECLKKSKKPYDMAYYAGKVDALEHMQEILEAKSV